MNSVLDLYNFDLPEFEGSKYVLTSPRSLEACSRIKVKPVELLQKTFDVFSQENTGKPIKLIEVLYKDWEEKRIALLLKCCQEREKILMEQQIAKNKQSKRKTHLNDKVSNDKVSSNNSLGSNPTFNSSGHSIITSDSQFNGTPSLKVNDFQTSASTTPQTKSLFVNKSDGLRSRSVESNTGQKCLKSVNGGSRSLSVLGGKSNFSSGYITPQIQRDRRLVELMKERRKQEAQDEKERRNKVIGWSKEQKQAEEMKRKEELQRQKELADSQLTWEKKHREEELKKAHKLRILEEERIYKQEQSEALARSNLEKQERLRMQLIEERKKMAIERKVKQERTLNETQLETLAHQKALEEEVKTKLERASRIKLENEMKELQKIKMMNRKQHLRYQDIQSELTKRKEAEDKMRKEVLERKLDRAAENYSRKIISRDLNMKNRARLTNYVIDQTKKKVKRMDKENQEHKQTIVQNKNEKVQRALDVAHETTRNKANRAKMTRMSCEEEWKKNLQLIHKKDKELIEQMKESLELKEDKVKRHQQLKEAALEFSRVQAKINEAERESIKRRSTNFHQMAQKAKLTADVGKGPRSSFVNYSTVKLG